MQLVECAMGPGHRKFFFGCTACHAAVYIWAVLPGLCVRGTVRGVEGLARPPLCHSGGKPFGGRHMGKAKSSTLERSHRHSRLILALLAPRALLGASALAVASTAQLALLALRTLLVLALLALRALLLALLALLALRALSALLALLALRAAVDRREEIMCIGGLHLLDAGI